MILKLSLVLLATCSIASCAENCTVAYTFLAGLNRILNANTQTLATTLNVQQKVVQYGFQAVFYEYYTAKSAYFINPLAYDVCSTQFDIMLNNALVRANLNPDGSVYNFSPCSADNVQFVWTDSAQTGTTLSWTLKQKTYSVSFKPLTDFLISGLQSALSEPAGSYNTFFSFSCSETQGLIFEYLKSQIAVAGCTLNDVLFQSTAAAFNNPTDLGYLASGLKLEYNNSTDDLASLISQYLAQSDSNNALEDFAANCLPQLNRLVSDYFSSLNISVANSIYMKNASSEAQASLCKTKMNTFQFDELSSTWSWKGGKLDMAPILEYFTAILEYNTPGIGMLSGLVSQRLQACSTFMQSSELTDQVFLYFRSILMGIDI